MITSKADSPKARRQPHARNSLSGMVAARIASTPAAMRLPSGGPMLGGMPRTPGVHCHCCARRRGERRRPIRRPVRILDQAQQQEQQRCCDADGCIRRDERNKCGGYAHEHEAGYKGGATAVLIAEVPQTTAPSGRARKPAANVPSASMVPTSGSLVGKKSLLKTNAAAVP